MDYATHRAMMNQHCTRRWLPTSPRRTFEGVGDTVDADGDVVDSDSSEEDQEETNFLNEIASPIVQQVAVSASATSSAASGSYCAPG